MKQKQNVDNEEEGEQWPAPQQSVDLTLLQTLTINDRKSSSASSFDSNLFDKDYSSFVQFKIDTPQQPTHPGAHSHNTHLNSHHNNHNSHHTHAQYTHPKSKPIQKGNTNSKQHSNTKTTAHRKRRIFYLQKRIQQLQKQINSLRRDERRCPNCRYTWMVAENYQYSYSHTASHIPTLHFQQQDTPDGQKRHSKDSLQFEKMDFNAPLMQTAQMEEKTWIFLGTMLIAMGSKVTDFDGTINTFQVMKQAVDSIRRQVQKSQPKINMEFFIHKQEIGEEHWPDGIGFNPFYNGKQDHKSGFILQGIKLQSVEQYQLLYDNKYNFSVQYDALITIMEYARDHCSLT